MTDTPLSLSSRFMAAFIDIEDHMRQSVYGAKIEAPGRFRALLEEFTTRARRHLSFKHERTLITLSELRNLLVHNKYFDGVPVAEPSMQAVQAIERIRDELLRPRTVLSVLNSPKPTTAHPDATVATTLQTMYRNDFSQMPVYNRQAVPRIADHEHRRTLAR